MIYLRNIRIKDHNLINFPRDSFLKELNNQKDGLYELVFRKQKVKRTLPQNSLYWVAYITPLAEYLGYSAIELHGIIKYLILRPEFNLKSTTELSKYEWTSFLDKIEFWAWNEFQFIIDKFKGE